MLSLRIRLSSAQPSVASLLVHTTERPGDRIGSCNFVDRETTKVELFAAESWFCQYAPFEHEYRFAEHEYPSLPDRPPRSSTTFCECSLLAEETRNISESIAETAERTYIAVAGGGLGQAEDFGDLLIRQFFEVPQRQHFAVK